jgi:hypothetical protein
MLRTRPDYAVAVARDCTSAMAEYRQPTLRSIAGVGMRVGRWADLLTEHVGAR